MKNRPLSFQLWFMTSLLIFCVMVLIFALMNFSVKDFFERQTFDTIEFSQTNRLINTKKLTKEAAYDVIDSIDATASPGAKEYERSVNHLFLTKKKLEEIEMVRIKDFPTISKVKNTILQQEETSKRYVFKSTKMVYTVVTKVTINNQELYAISYMHETYTRGLIDSMNRTILIVLIISLFLSSIIARFIANRITRPLKAVEVQLNHIANKEWTEDLHLNRKDEIGRLSKSANLMQATLQAKDVEEKHFIQKVSHDLKTPIMVIRSYSQAVLDGIIEPADIQNSIQLIDHEASKMDGKIKDLVYLYTLRNQPIAYDDYTQLEAQSYIENLIKRFQYTNDAIKFDAQLSKCLLQVNEKTFTVAIENIIENALRFAKTTIRISCNDTASEIQIKIYNDGSSLENPKKIFIRYETESRGNTGLGMAITREVIENHNGHIEAINEEDGVSFIIHLPKLL